MRHHDRTRVPSAVNPDVISSSISSTLAACRASDWEKNLVPPNTSIRMAVTLGGSGDERQG